MKSIFSMFAYWDRVHQFPDRHIKVENNLSWRRKYLHACNRNKQLIFQRIKEETRKVVVLDWEDKNKLQQAIKDLEKISETYKSICKDVTIINNTIYYLRIIEEKINQCMKNKILNLAKPTIWFVLCLLVSALAFEGVFSLTNRNKPAKEFSTAVFSEKGHEYLVVNTKNGVSVIHAESCPCHKKKQRMKIKKK